VACLEPRAFAAPPVGAERTAYPAAPSTRTERVDFFGNRLCFFTVQEPHKELVVEARSEVTMDGHAMPWPKHPLPWEEVAKAVPNDHSPAGLEAYQFAFESPRVRVRPEFVSYALQSFTPGRPMPEALLDLTARIQKTFVRFESDQRADDSRRSVSETAGCVPGFRTRANRLPPLPESLGPLC